MKKQILFVTGLLASYSSVFASNPFWDAKVEIADPVQPVSVATPPTDLFNPPWHLVYGPTIVLSI